MKFEIQTVWNWGDHVKMLEDYPCLKDYGFEPIKVRRVCYERFMDENGRPIKQEKSHTVDRMMVSVNSLEQLLELVRAVQEPIIISPLDEKHASFNIEIYDGYRE